MAKQRLAHLETISQQTKNAHENPQADLLFVADLQETTQIPPLVPTESEVEKALAQIDPDELTPRQALDELYRLKKLLA